MKNSQTTGLQSETAGKITCSLFLYSQLCFSSLAVKSSVGFCNLSELFKAFVLLCSQSSRRCSLVEFESKLLIVNFGSQRLSLEFQKELAST